MENTSPKAAETNNPLSMIPTEFDARAQQRVPIKVEFDGEFYLVDHVFAPYDNEDVMTEYAKRCKTILRSSEVKGAVDRESDTFDANVWLWNKLAVGIEGMGEEEDEQPENWKGLVDDDDKNYAVKQLLATEIVPLDTVAKESGKRLPWGYKKTNSLIQLRARFGAYQITLGHYMKKADPQQTKRFHTLLSRSQQVTGSRLSQPDTMLPSSARDLGKLYKELQEEAVGYKDNIVPLNHQVDVLVHHLIGNREGVIKN